MVRAIPVAVARIVAFSDLFQRPVRPGSAALALRHLVDHDVVEVGQPVLTFFRGGMAYNQMAATVGTRSTPTKEPSATQRISRT